MCESFGMQLAYMVGGAFTLAAIGLFVYLKITEKKNK